MRYSLFIILFATPFFVYADESSDDEIGLPSFLLFSIGGDQDDSLSLDAMADIDFISGSRLGVGYGINHSADVDLTTQSVFADISTDASSRLFGGIGFDYWGNEDAIVINGLNISLGLNEGNWQFGINPSFRSIKLNTIEDVVISEYEIQSRTWLISAQYFGFENWSIGGGVEFSRYSIANLNNVNRRLLWYFTSSSAKMLATSLSKQRRFVHVDRYFDWGGIGFMCGRSTTVIGDTEVGDCQANTTWFAGDRWEFGLSATNQVIENTSYLSGDLSTRYFF